MHDDSSGRGDEGMRALRVAVDEAMRPVIEAAAHAAVLAAQRGDELPSEDPDVLLEGIYELHRAAGEWWERFVEDVERLMSGHDPGDIDDSLCVVESLTEAARVLADQLLGAPST